ncbi:MAG: hypothetical protein D6798_19025 [Deltaproteobacteria bacterium]|nr:MAG: hypothetical protein D6798_19025 [Deltaproteobacteria bacterium]
MRRGPGIAAALVVLGAGAVAGGGLWALHRAEAALARRGLHWQGRRVSGAAVTWIEVEGDGVHADRVVGRLLPRPTITLVGVDVDVATLDVAALDVARLGASDSPRPTADGERPAAIPRSVRVEVEDLAVRWGQRVLVDGLAGPLRPTVALSGDGVRIERRDGAWQASLDRAVDLGPLRAQGRLDLRWAGDDLHADFRAQDAVLSHPLLANGPLPPHPLRVTLDHRLDDGTVDLALRLGDVEAVVTGHVDLRSRRADLHVSADAVPLDAVIDLFGRYVPEGDRATCRGTVGLSVDVSGPPLRWEAWPRAEDLTCQGVLGDIDALRSGAVTWKAMGPDGQPTIKRTGPGRPLWTPWPEARRVGEAMMAAEDIRFLEHPGYDLVAIKEVLDEIAGGSDRLRGGSTLTQQLAKNLYLDGERTLARKLRELIYALDLEASLDKRHIMQLYVNIVELGPDIHGVGAAAHTYFARRPGALTDREAAFLAALLPDPRGGYRRAMAGHPPNARIDAILDNMGRAGLRTPEEVARARRDRLLILPPPP